MELSSIRCILGGRPVLHDVNLRVPAGATRALIGSSGSGKTTLLRIALGVLKPTMGSVRIAGSLLPREGAGAGWAENFGYVPQDGGLFPHITAASNATLLARRRGWSRDQCRERLRQLAALVGLEISLLKRYPFQLSGGQRQRVALVRACFLDPPVLFLDEPMGALDPLVRSALQEELKAIFHRLGKTVLLVTHDLAEAAYLAEGITLLHQGRVMQTGTYADLARAPADPYVTQFLLAQRTLPALGSRS